MTARYLFIVNPLSGAGRGKVVAGLLNRLLPYHPTFSDGRGKVFLTTDEDVAARNEAMARAETLIAVGGDGTASHLMPHLLASDSPPTLGIIPLGTSNDLACALGVPVKEDYARAPVLRKALDNISRSKQGKIDVFCVNGKVYFCNYFSMGFDAAIVKDFDRARDTKWTGVIPHGRLINNLLYFLLGLKNLSFYLKPVIEIDYENGSEKHQMTIDSPCRAIIVSNLPVYAGGCRLRSDAFKDDGSFEVTIVHTIGQYAKIILSRFLPFVQMPSGLGKHQAQHATIRLSDIPPCQIDGEKCSKPAVITSNFEITFRARLRVLISAASPLPATNLL